MPRIRDLSVEDVRQGKNWRLKPSTKVPKDMAAWEIEPLRELHPDDDVVYAALGVINENRVVPLVVVKTLRSPEYLGDVAYYVKGRWGPRPDRSEFTRLEEIYVANPLDDDPSFFGQDTRERQRSGFQHYKALL